MDNASIDREHKNPPIVCISLPDEQGRRARMASQFEHSNLSFHFFDAIRVDHDPAKYPTQYDAALRIRMFGKHLRPGEVGCYLSHREVWRQLAQSADSAWCVLEDDVILTPRFISSVAALIKCIDRWDVVRLVQSHRQPFRVVQPLCNEVELVAFDKQPSGAIAYLITRQAAMRLYAFTEKIVRPIDDMMDRHWEHHLRVLGLSPDVVAHDWDTPTTIPGRAKERRTAGQKILHNFYTSRDSINRRWYNFRTRLLRSDHSGS